MLAFCALAVGGAVVVVSLVFALGPAPRRPVVVVPAVFGGLLLLIWVVMSYRGGVQADETQTVGNIFDDVSWLVAAVIASLFSLARTRRRRHPSSAHHTV